MTRPQFLTGIGTSVFLHHHVHTSSGVYPAPCPVGIRAPPLKDKIAHCIKLIMHLYLMLRLRMQGALLLLLCVFSWCVISKESRQLVLPTTSCNENNAQSYIPAWKKKETMQLLLLFLIWLCVAMHALKFWNQSITGPQPFTAFARSNSVSNVLSYYTLPHVD
jgi:hypothetical protein